MSAELRRYARNVCGVERELAGLVRPRTRGQVQAIVRAARATGVPIYPISTGKNWGLGGRLPVQDGAVVVDLGGMNRIRAFDPRAGTVEIEPGVTQKQLADFLRRRRAKFRLDVTGSAASSSVVGNALERGVAHFGCRVPEVLGLEVMLGTGELLRAGAGSVRGSRSGRTYPFGVGADLRGLFFQSNFAIVTAVTLRLIPKRETVGVFSIEPRSGCRLADWVDELSEAARQGFLPENFHLSNRARRLSVLTPLYAREMGLGTSAAQAIVESLVVSDWAATASWSGTRAGIALGARGFRSFAAARKRPATGALRVSWEEDFAPRARRKLSPLARAARGSFLHACGVPSDAAIPSLGYALDLPLSGDPVDSVVGTLFLVPVLPFTGRDVVRVERIVNRIFRRAGFVPFITFNAVEGRNLEAVVNLCFDRRDRGEVRRAHACVLRAFRELLAAGYPPQRMSIFQMPEFYRKRLADPGLREASRGLKRLFDPDGIIAPGRYEAEAEAEA